MPKHDKDCLHCQMIGVILKYIEKHDGDDNLGDVIANAIVWLAGEQMSQHEPKVRAKMHAHIDAHCARILADEQPHLHS